MGSTTFSTCILIGLILFTGCSTQKRCSRLYPPTTETIVKDSIREVTTYRDTTIFINLPADTVTTSDTIFIKNGSIQFKPITAETNLATAKACIAFNRINLTLMDKDSTIQIRLNDALISRDFWRSKYSSERQIQIVKETPMFWKVFGYIGIFCSVIIIVYLYFRFK